MEALTDVLARTLRNWRKRNGLKIKAAADELGVSPATWGHWETGARFPAAKHLSLLSLYLGIPTCQLICSLGRGCDNGVKSCPLNVRRNWQK